MGKQVAADGLLFWIEGKTVLPRTEFRRLDGEDDLFFWDEYRNEEGETVGFWFVAPESQTLRESTLLTDCSNVSFSDSEISILLSPCANPVVSCLQGFGSQVYVNSTNERDCVILMDNFWGDAIGFPLALLN